MKLSLLLAFALFAAPALRAEEEQKEAAPAEQKAEEKAEKAAEKADQATEKTADHAEKAAEKADEKAEKAAEKADEKADKAADKAEEKAGKAADKAEEKAGKAKDKAEKKAGKAKDKADKAAGKADRGHVDAALAFLKAWAQTNRKGDQGTKAWDALKQHAADDKVEVKIGGKAHDIDIAGKKSDAKLQKFSKLSTWRDGKEIKGVAVEVLDVAVDKETHHKGKAKIHMTEKDGAWHVDSIEAD